MWLVLAQSPGKFEVVKGKPLVGPSGLELNKWLSAADLHWSQFDRDNVMSCRPPGDKLSTVMGRIRAENARRRKVNQKRRAAREELAPMLPTPMECCRPRLREHLDGYVGVLALGGDALQAVLPEVRGGILNVRGTLHSRPLPNGQIQKVLPTLHPSFVLHEPRWRPVAFRDVQRAVRHFAGEPNWTRGPVTYQPSPDALARYLHTPDVRFWPFDVETDGLRAATARMRCIGVGREDRDAMVVPLLSIDGVMHLYSAREEALVREILAEFLGNTRRLKVGHNAGWYDRINCEAQLGVTPAPILDTMLLHALAWSELPHSLLLCGSFYLDVTDWKGAHTATQAKTDKELWTYNGTDVLVNAGFLDELVKDVDRVGQRPLVSLLHKLQGVGVGMHKVGMQVALEARPGWAVPDPAWWERTSVRDRKHAAPQTRDEWEGHLQCQVSYYAERCRKALMELELADAIAAVRDDVRAERLRSTDWSDDTSDPMDQLERETIQDGTITDEELAELLTAAGVDATTFNPGSPAQLRAILYDAWALTPPARLERKDAYTPSGALSVDADVLRAFAVDRRLTKEQQDLLLLVLRYREALKLWGYVAALHHTPHTAEERHRYAVARLTGKKVKERFEGNLWADGRLHVDWKIHVAVTTRWASSPNVQNWPIPLRSMWIPGVGHVFVYADYDQIELRIGADRWRAGRYLEALGRGQDPHQVTMNLIFGDRMWAWDGAPSKADRYFKRYGKGSYFDDMRDLAKRIQYASQYGAGAPTVFRVITSAVDEFGKLLYPKLTLRQVSMMHEKWLEGCSEFPVGWAKELAFHAEHGYIEEPVTHRRRVCAAGNPNEIINFPIQGSASGIVNKAVLRLVEAFPFFGPDGPGLNNVMHDSVTLELVHTVAARRLNEVREILHSREDCFPDVEFVAKPEIMERLAS